MSDEKPGQEQYDPPEVEQIPTDSGPSVTAAGDSPPQDGQGGGGPEWRPTEGGE
jgi:hypothetical protein